MTTRRSSLRFSVGTEQPAERRLTGRKRRSTMAAAPSCPSPIKEDDDDASIGMLGSTASSLTGSAEGSDASLSEAKCMRVVVRIRPLSSTEVSAGRRICCSVVNERTVVISKEATTGAYLKSQQGQINEYAFDAAFDCGASQMDVYNGSTKPYIGDVLDGINVTVFAYGATGAGKTHTMMGSERIVGTRLDSDSAEEVSGIVPSSLVDIFRKINMRKQSPTERDEQWIVKVGYLEVYNEQILCLLKPGRPLRVCEDPAKGFVQVAGLEERIVNSSDEVLDLLREGNANRKTEATMANQVSSRSHAVLQVSVTRKYTDSYGQDAVREAKLCLIDLAGSERASATNNSGALLRQGANINKSLLSLANCINALAHNSRRQSQSKSNVKYRDSKLTHLLKASLEGNCRVVMIANINPSHITYEDTHNTLKYANRAKNIKIAPRKTLGVEDVPWPVREARLLKENAELRDANVELQSEIETLRQQAGEIKPLEDSSVKRRRVSVSEQDVSDTIATLEDHLYKLKAERSDLQAQLLRVRTEKNDLYVKMEELQQVQETQSSNVNAAKPNPRLVEDLEKQLHKKDADIHHLQEENDKLREDMWQAIAQTRHADMMDEGDTSILEKIKEENERLRGQLIAAGDAPDYSSTILKLGDDCSRHQQRADKLETRVQELEQIRTLLLNELAQALPPQQKAAPASIQTPEKDEFQFEQSNAYSPFQVGSPDMAPPSKRGGAVKSRSRRSSFIPRPARRGADENDAGCDAVEEKLQTNTLARRTRSRLSLVPIRSTRLD